VYVPGGTSITNVPSGFEVSSAPSGSIVTLAARPLPLKSRTTPRICDLGWTRASVSSTVAPVPPTIVAVAVADS
jgi:hypothetical protein